MNRLLFPVMLVLACLPLRSFAQDSLPAAKAQTPSAPAGKKRIAILANFWGANSHADIIATKFFTGFPIDTGLESPQVDVASIWVAENDPNDVAHKLAEKFKVPIYPTIAEALTLGGKSLAVDGVLYVGEHGKYTVGRYGTRMYPHLNHLDQVFRVFDASKRSVPVYNDKQLAYSWLDSKWIYDRARELNVPLMAGSVLPLTWRDPVLVHPVGANITEAVVVGYGGLDAYAFHSLEILQCMVERRKGGETGVTSVQCLRGEAVYQAAAEGKFSMELAEAACQKCPTRKSGSMQEGEKNPIAILIQYKDGTKGAVILAGRYVGEYWGYAARVDGKIESCHFVSPPKPIYAYFSYLGLNIQKFFLAGQTQYPVERTLLTSGINDVALQSLAQEGRAIETPYFDIRYEPAKSEPLWPKATEPAGASIGAWPPPGFEFLKTGK